MKELFFLQSYQQITGKSISKTKKAVTKGTLNYFYSVLTSHSFYFGLVVLKEWKGNLRK